MAFSVKDEAQKLRQTIDKDYEAGKQAGGGTSEEDYDRGYAEGVTAGEQAEYDRFWDANQENGNRTNYGSAYVNKWWNNVTFRPKYSMKPGAYAVTSMFEYCGYEGDLAALCEQQGITIDFSDCVEFQRVFYGSKFTRIGVIDARKATRFYAVFNESRALKIIDKLIVAETTPILWSFANLSALEEIQFEGVIGSALDISNSPLLSSASVQSIIDHLKDLTGATAQKLSLHTDVILNLTDEQALAITAKNWTI